MSCPSDGGDAGGDDGWRRSSPDRDDDEQNVKEEEEEHEIRPIAGGGWPEGRSSQATCVDLPSDLHGLDSGVAF